MKDDALIANAEALARQYQRMNTTLTVTLRALVTRLQAAEKYIEVAYDNWTSSPLEDNAYWAWRASKSPKP